MTYRELRCEELVELVTDYIEGALDDLTREEVERHLAYCPHCTTYLGQMRETIRQLGRLRVADIAPDALDELLQAFSTEHPT